VKGRFELPVRIFAWDEISSGVKIDPAQPRTFSPLHGGDFFDIIPQNDHRLALALGDVSGKGIVASVLMTAAQGFLHSALTQCTDPVQAVNRPAVPAVGGSEPAGSAAFIRGPRGAGPSRSSRPWP